MGGLVFVHYRGREDFIFSESEDKMIVAEIGSISQGTMKSRDLVQCFLETLEYLAEGATDLTIAITNRMEFSDKEDNCYDYYESIDIDDDVHELFDVLGEYAPENCYFGAHPGDGADYGFWRIEEDLK